MKAGKYLVKYECAKCEEGTPGAYTIVGYDSIDQIPIYLKHQPCPICKTANAMHLVHELIKPIGQSLTGPEFTYADPRPYFRMSKETAWMIRLNLGRIIIDPSIDYVNYEGCLEMFWAQMIRDNGVKCSDEVCWNNSAVKRIIQDEFKKSIPIDAVLPKLENHFDILFPGRRIKVLKKDSI